MLLSILLQTACDDGGKFGKYDNKKILSEYQRCLSQPNPSRSRAIVCGNYERECLRRKKNGNNICAM
ncbi:MAG: hypothetical protein QM504_08535 [Pseudomonadota bacterium]